MNIMKKKDLIKIFGGIDKYNQCPVTNAVVKSILNGGNETHLLVDCIRIINKQQLKIKELTENQPHTIVLTKEELTWAKNTLQA